MELLKAIGGGTTALIALLTIFKNMFMKFFEKGIDSAFEKNIEKYKNKLTRSTTAFEILLTKEIDFYNKVDPLFAELIILIQDLVYTSDFTNEIPADKRCEEYRKHMLRFLELIKEIKNEILLHQSYIPDNIFSASSTLVGEMQSNLEHLKLVRDKLFEKTNNKINIMQLTELKNTILKQIAYSETLIKTRLTDLSMVE